MFLKPIVFLLLFFHGSAVTASDILHTEELFTQIAELRRDNQALRKELNELKKEVTDLKQNIDQYQKLITDAKQMLNKAPSIGDKEAELIVIEFTDFQCPYCKKHEMNTFAKLKESYMDKGKVQYVVKDFPLSFHGQAKPAAIAANCAGDQESYWAMRHKLFENQRNLGQQLFKQFAEELKLDQLAFVRCIEDPQQANKVEQDISYADQIGIRSTPSFVIARKKGDRLQDIKMIAGAQSYNNFSRVLDAMLTTDSR